MQEQQKAKLEPQTVEPIVQRALETLPDIVSTLPTVLESTTISAPTMFLNEKGATPIQDDKSRTYRMRDRDGC
ncbi:uncharacterized protein SPSK_10213 [Sporothrix schenckii 1099-18]|uniref:Uncharacterized protein n=1 Tax=Sporothrix schenckii 1099-18 TaxID=1397361 RepID=A0A0F2M7V7_SPOSC|nr:uncharacterized protein SPSK_10213 [Sporothrix schenckii 1099-18]KJR85722.1 hypothetical protein SPSK_10213 [Sporothrix schenckii 1099-18]